MSRPPYHPSMQFCVLGPLSVRGPLGEVDVVGGKERMLLAHLVSAAGRLVTVDELTDSLWGERPAAGARGRRCRPTCCGCATRWSRSGAGVAHPRGDRGGRLPAGGAGPGRRRAPVRPARGARTPGAGRPEDPAKRPRRCARQGDLWRGPAYAGLRGDALRPRGAAAARRAPGECDRGPLGGRGRPGRAAASIPELERMVAEHPWRERAWGLLVLALFRAGRQGDALGALGPCPPPPGRRLGVDPGPELREPHGRFWPMTRPPAASC